MGRPSKSANEKPARERIKRAFWKLYKKRPIEQICVKEICAGACCNKTTFYYHFENTAQVLAEIEHECLLIDFPGLIVSLLTEDEPHTDFIEAYVQANASKIETISILLGPCGDPSFRLLLEEETVNRWCDIMGIEREMLDREDRLFLRYSTGGMASLCAQMQQGNGEGFDYYATIIKLAREVIVPRVQLMVSRYDTQTSK